MRNPLTTILPEKFLDRTPRASRALSEIEHELDKWMWQSPIDWPGVNNRFNFQPACDFDESNMEYKVQLDIPGIKKKDVKIEIENNRLTVNGERKVKMEEKDSKRFLSEAYYGSFMRSFSLPSLVNEEKVSAHYEDGVLTITVPKLETSKAKKVKIQ